MQVFSWQAGTRIVSGENSMERLGELAAELQSRRVLLVTDAGVASAGHAARAADQLVAQSLSVQIFQDVLPNPSTDDVQRGVAVAREFQPDLLIGLGGGSAMDCAKGMNFVLTSGGRMEDYRGYGKATAPMLPLVAIPTTAGTGSEVQSYALITDCATNQKMACGDSKARPWAAVLDPQLLLTTPPNVAAMAAVDAVSHAVESYVTTGRNRVSEMLSREAYRLLVSATDRAFQDPSDVHAWSDVQWGACLAGMAIEHSMLGAAHALANPLTAHFKIPHGQAVAVCLPHVVRFNSQTHAHLYDELWTSCGSGTVGGTHDGLAVWLGALTQRLGLRTTLSSLTIDAAALRQLSVEAAEQWTARHNPRPLTAEDALALYRAAW